MANGESLLKGDQKRIADRNAMRTGKKAQLDKKFGRVSRHCWKRDNVFHSTEQAVNGVHLKGYQQGQPKLGTNKAGMAHCDKKKEEELAACALDSLDAR